MDIRSEAHAHLTGKLIPFWQALRDTRHGGYYGFIDFDLHVDRQAPKGCILNSRILWFFSKAYQALGDPALLEHARHAYAFADRFWDGEHGGVYWACSFDGAPLDTAKHTYAQAFAIYALSAYAAAAGDSQALGKAMALFQLVETQMASEPGYLEAFDRAYRPLANHKLSDNPRLEARGVVAEKTMNTMLHLMEAYAELYAASGDRHVKARLQALLLLIADRVYNWKENRLEVFFDAALRPVASMQSYGHDIEASWLIDVAAAVQEPAERAKTLACTQALAQGVLQRAYRDGSLLNEALDGETDATRIWWVQAETMVGLANLWQKTGDPAIQNQMHKTWRFIMAHMADPRPGGEWYWSLTPEGAPCRKPIVEPWKCPYHNGRMCLELMARLD